MIGATFKSGNYNTVDRWVKDLIPAKFSLIRYDLIPAIEKTLVTMLGDSNGIIKNEINVSQIIDKEGLKGFLCELSYIVDDFKVEEAPKEAIEEDQKKIAEALKKDYYQIKKVEIDTSTGIMFISCEVPLEVE